MIRSTWLSLISTRRGPLLTMCLPVLCACSLSWFSAPQGVANVPKLPGLSFDQYLVDLREVPPTEEVFGYFGFRNTGKHRVTITKLEPSCGCLTPQLKKREFEPGEGTEFLLRIKTALQKPGFKEFSVKVHYNDPEPRTQDVFLRATFPTKQIYVSPMSLTMHQMGTSAVEQELLITDLRETPAEILGVSSTCDLLQLQVLPPETTSKGAQRQKIRVTLPGPIAAGRQMATIKIYTNDERFHELKVPIQVFGPSQHAGKKATMQQAYGPQEYGPVRR